MVRLDAEQIRKELGHRIRVRRVEMCLKQRDIADAFGMNASAVTHWESGKRAIKAEDLVNLALLLKTSVGYLVGEQERQPVRYAETQQRQLF